MNIYLILFIALSAITVFAMIRHYCVWRLRYKKVMKILGDYDHLIDMGAYHGLLTLRARKRNSYRDQVCLKIFIPITIVMIVANVVVVWVRLPQPNPFDDIHNLRVAICEDHELLEQVADARLPVLVGLETGTVEGVVTTTAKLSLNSALISDKKDNGLNVQELHAPINDFLTKWPDDFVMVGCGAVIVLSIFFTGCFAALSAGCVSWMSAALFCGIRDREKGRKSVTNTDAKDADTEHCYNRKSRISYSGR